MAERTVVICDQCGKQEDAKSTVNWLSVKSGYIDTRVFGRDYLDGDYCSLECLENRIKNLKANRT
jgi:hypothetical protein